MLYTLASEQASPDFEELCSFIRLRLRRRALVMILTDLDDPTSAEAFLKTVDFISRQHMVIVAMIRPEGVAPIFTNQDLDSTDGMSWKTADSSAREIVKSFLFSEEVKLSGDGIEGGEDFAKAFIAGGVETTKGKSLRDFRLYERLFKTRCSYMIHSKAFRGLPDLVRERVLHHLRSDLSEASQNHLSSRETVNRVLRSDLAAATTTMWR